MPTTRELLDALPPDLRESPGEAALADAVAAAAGRPAPAGRLRRALCLSSLQCRIALGYLAWWLRSGFVAESDRQRSLNETHLATALRLVAGMTYLRGAIMKVGQALATYPRLVPDELTDALASLHFEAEPMHFSLLRELVRTELGGDPEDLFAEFDRTAFAAASLGQVHRARLRDGRPVAVKIQYPDMGRTVRSDLRNLQAALAPMRLARDWRNVRDQIREIGRKLEEETDYLHEAELLESARRAFREEDGILVPRVHGSLTSARVLTMDLVPGLHLPDYLRGAPSQGDRDRRAAQIYRAALRLYYSRRMVYADPHPGNYLFLPDGRLGLLDFGCCHVFGDEDWAFMMRIERSLFQGAGALREAIVVGSDLSERQAADEDLMRRLERVMAWMTAPVEVEEPFDFGAEGYMAEGFEAMAAVLARGHVRNRPSNNWLHRSFLGVRALCHRLRARVPVRELQLEEMRRAEQASS